MKPVWGCKRVRMGIESRDSSLFLLYFYYKLTGAFNCVGFVLLKYLIVVEDRRRGRERALAGNILIWLSNFVNFTKFDCLDVLRLTFN